LTWQAAEVIVHKVGRWTWLACVAAVVTLSACGSTASGAPTAVAPEGDSIVPPTDVPNGDDTSTTVPTGVEGVDYLDVTFEGSDFECLPDPDRPQSWWRCVTDNGDTRMPETVDTPELYCETTGNVSDPVITCDPEGYPSTLEPEMTAPPAVEGVDYLRVRWANQNYACIPGLGYGKWKCDRDYGQGVGDYILNPDLYCTEFASGTVCDPHTYPQNPLSTTEPDRPVEGRDYLMVNFDRSQYLCAPGMLYHQWSCEKTILGPPNSRPVQVLFPTLWCEQSLSGGDLKCSQSRH
jgi:hypothetical protein